jgi:phage virion morphogenesis protein
VSTIEINAAQLDQLIARVRRAALADKRGLLDAIGQQQEDAARKRITLTKRTPGGTRWRDWSADYRRTRIPGQHSLLRDRGDLLDRMTHAVEGDDAVLVGSPMEYAGYHLFGKHARPFLDTDGGFADPKDRDEISDLVEAFLTDLIA